VCAAALDLSDLYTADGWDIQPAPTSADNNFRANNLVTRRRVGNRRHPAGLSGMGKKDDRQQSKY
jgi:hypothetical protein